MWCNILLSSTIFPVFECIAFYENMSASPRLVHSLEDQWFGQEQSCTFSDNPVTLVV